MWRSGEAGFLGSAQGDDGTGDPVELSPDEARRVAYTLLAFAEKADGPTG